MNVQKLLDDVTLWHESHKKANALFSRQLAPDFKLFSLFNVNEMALSNCLAFLLDENETHGQKDLFITKFYELFQSNHDTKKELKLAPNQYRVYTEYTIDTGRRIDILMTDSKNYIAIENKPWADDQKEQLKDYGYWLQKSAHNNENWLLIYLCNKEISDYTLPKETDISIQQNVLAITFRELLIWLTDCQLYVQAPKIRVFIEALMQFIQEEVNWEIDMTLQNELNKIILSKPSNISAALLIEKNIKALKLILFHQFITHINQQIADLGITVELDSDIEKCYAGFAVMFEHHDRFLLRWEFEKSGQQKLYYGVRRRDKTIEQDHERYQKIMLAAKDIIPINPTAEWWPAWARADEKAMPSNIDENIWLEFNQPENSDFAKSVINIIRTVYKNTELRQLLK